MGVEASQCDIAGMRLFEVSSGKSFQLLWRSTYGYNYFTGTKQDHSLLPPANEVCEGYVFTGVCLSTGGCLPRCLWADTPRQTPPGQTPPSPSQCMLGYTPLYSACWDTVNKRTVRIPLECILVFHEIFWIIVCCST